MDCINELKKYELKITPQRLEIVDILYKYGHINIDELYTKLQTKFPSLSLATIYKNLKLMSQKGFVSEVKILNHKSVYELTKEEHSHIVCTNCNDIVDIELDISPLILQAQNSTNFQIQHSSIVFDGICKKCS